MRKLLLSILSIFVWTLAAQAQTPQEIVSRMEAELEKFDENQGVAMTLDIKVPILGTMTTQCYNLGDKTRMEANTMGVKVITWDDGETEWTYTDKTNTVTIEKVKQSSSSSSAEGDMDMFDDILDGYDVSLKKEDAKAWYIRCKKKKGNADKDAPKSMDIAVRKSDYFPLSLSATLSGVTMTMRNFSFGVTEKQVTFNLADYPGATVEDKR